VFREGTMCLVKWCVDISDNVLSEVMLFKVIC